MKIRSRRLMALMLSAAMVFPAAPAASATETQESLQSQAPAETQAQPAPETQPQTAVETQAQTAAETQPQTAAETQAQSASETQAAPETQPQSASETQPAPETQPQGGTEPGTQASESSKETETQKETETDQAEKGSFEAKSNGVSLKLMLPKGEKLPADTKLTLKESDAKSGQKQTALVRKALEKAQRSVENVCLLTITAVDKDGKAVTLPKGTTLSFSFGNGLDLGIAERREGQIHFLEVGDQASDAGASLKVSQDQTKLVSASVSLGSEGKESLTFAAASLQDRENNGGKLSAGDVNDFAGAGAYAAVAEHFDGKKDEKTQVLAGDNGKDDKERAENLKKAQSLLGGLASYSASLADAQDSDSVRVVNLYADDNGDVNTAAEAVTDPMYGVKAADGTIDVTSGYVVVNIIAKSADQTIHIPDFAVTYAENGKSQAVTADAHPELAQHLIVNIAAGNGRDGKDFSFVSYTGKADRGGAAGVYLAPAGTIRFAGALTGAVYAKNAAVDGKLTHAAEAGQTGKSKEDANEAAAKKGTAALMAETAAEASQNAADKDSADDSRQAFSGTLKVSAASKNTDGTKTELEGVVFSLYERTEGQTDGQKDQLVYSWTSGKAAKQIPAGLLKERRTYVVREEAMPVSENSTGSTGTVTYAKLAETVFTVTAADTGTAAGIKLTKNSNGDAVKLLKEGASDYELDYMHESSQTPESSQNLVTIESKDPSGTDVPGSQVTIERQTSETAASGKAQWNQVAAFTMQGSAVSFDFGSSLPGKKDGSQPQNGDTAVFHITESAPAGLTSLTRGGTSAAEPADRVSTTLTFTYHSEQTQGQTTEHAGWQLTSRTRVYAYGSSQDTEQEIKGQAAASVTFTDAYLVSLTSSQVNYSKESENTLVQNLKGASITLQSDGGLLEAGADYLVYTIKDGNADQKQNVSGNSFTMPNSSVQLVLLSKGTGTGSTVKVSGKWGEKDSYHFISGGNGASDTLTAPVEGQNGTYSREIPALKLKSRIQAVVNLSSVDDAGNAHLSGTSGIVKANVAGTEGEIKSNPTKFVLNDPNLDDVVTGMLQTGTTLYIVGTQNWSGYSFSSVNGFISAVNQPQDGNTVTIEAKLTSVQTPVTVDGTIVVTKELYRASTGKRLPVTVQKQYQVRVFMDAGGTLPYGDAQTLTVPKNNSTSGTIGSARFTVPVDALHGTTYYVFEVDAEGRSVKNNSDMKIQIQGGDRDGGNGAAVTMKALALDGYGAGTGKTYVVADKTIRLQTFYTEAYYNAHRSEFMSNGTFDIQLRVVDASGNELPVDNLVAEFRVRTRDGKLALKNNQKITLKNTSVGERKNISFPVPIDTGKQAMGVTLMSIRTTAGVSLAKDYTLLTASYDGNFSKVGSRTGERTFTINADAENQGPVVFVLRKNETNEKASLTLTKSVMYKKTPIRVNATYYIGIFADAAHTKLLFKKAMSLKDASSMSDTLKVNINSQKGRTITLYFAETDRNGKVVESGKKTGYNISISSPQVTLSQSNMNANVTVTNEILDGSRAAERLTDPDSGFAGDSAALADAQALASSSNLNSKTGDDSPLTRYVLLLVIAGAGVAAGLYLALRRRKV
ncbi:hypothetical protein ACTQ1N_03430 [Porcincola sp. LCP21S3_C12]|uniref:hypothetical protein n=1 Tax=Porcincola sp. LCP21S3_C12 TaxID=3438798 RepID=UPI003F9A10A0